MSKEDVREVVGKRQGQNQFSDVVYMCPKPCGQRLIGTADMYYNIEVCPKCGRNLKVIPPKSER